MGLDMLKVGDLVLWGINVSPAWHVVVERTQFKGTTQYSFVTLTTGAVTSEWFDTLDDLNECYKCFITSSIRPVFSPTIEEVKNESSNRMNAALEKDLEMIDKIGLFQKKSADIEEIAE